MANLQLGEAFARFGARATNPVWSVCAWASDVALVVSCWSQLFKKAVNGVLPYEGGLVDWPGPGCNELRANLHKAFEEHRPVRVIIATSQDTAQFGHEVPKTFHVRDDLVGTITQLEEEHFRIDFRRSMSASL
jgi:hypothetical protein